MYRACTRRGNMTPSPKPDKTDDSTPYSAQPLRRTENMNMERYFLANAAETYAVDLPEYLVTAKAFLDAATKYRTEVEALEQPTLEGVNAKNIAKTIDAILVFSQ